MKFVKYKNKHINVKSVLALLAIMVIFDKIFTSAYKKKVDIFSKIVIRGL